MSYNPKYNFTYSVKIPSVEKRVEYREYTVGEEKEIILIDSEESISKKFYKIKNLVKKCLLTEIDFEKISPSEILFLFIHMRIQSVSFASVPCPKCLEALDDDMALITQLEEVKGNETNQAEIIALSKQIKSLNDTIRKKYEALQNDVKISLKDIKIIENKNHAKIIKLSDTLSIEMKYGINSTDSLEREVDTLNKSDEELVIIQDDDDIETIARCIETIYDGENTISGLSLKEKLNILVSLPSKYRKKLEAFLETQPTIEYTNKTVCKSCKNEFDFTLTTINDFF